MTAPDTAPNGDQDRIPTTAANARLVLPFDTDSAEFVRGVEVGRIWERLTAGERVEMTVHGSNAEMVLRMAEAAGRRLSVDNLDPTWMRVAL